MDNIRFVLIIVLAMLSIMLWQAWQLDYGPKPAVSSIENTVNNSNAELPAQNNAEATQSMQQAAPAVQQEAQSKTITIKTDVFNVQLDTLGGTLVNLDLLAYPVDKKNTSVNSIRNKFGLSDSEKDLTPIRLFDNSLEKLFLAQSGLIAGNDSAEAANHHSIFTATQPEFVMPQGQNELVVPLTWTNGQGLTVVKKFTFTRGSYVVNLEQTVINKTDKPWNGRQYTQFLRIPYSDPTGNSFIRTYAGGVIYTEENKYQKAQFSDMASEDINETTLGGWSAMIQHYFAAAWIPPTNERNSMYTKALEDNKFVIGSYSPIVSVLPNTEAPLKSTLFVGPKIQPVLEKTAKGLELTVDYGWLTVIAKPIYSLLNFIHSYIGNWGFSILGVTFVIKLLFFPLSASSYKSMAKMRKIQPRLKEMQERYADNRQLFNQKMMAMYKEEKVNPLGGCLPILVQIPVFISLYWVLIETVELRQAPFALWIQDLSSQDPYYILPILYGITMKIQQGLNPPPIDPIQAKIMKMFPIVFTFFFLFFPAGLVLYWIMNNTLSILQQWYITKHIVGEEKPAH